MEETELEWENVKLFQFESAGGVECAQVQWQLFRSHKSLNLRSSHKQFLSVSPLIMSSRPPQNPDNIINLR